MNIFSICIIYLFIWKTKKNWEKDGDLPSASSLPKCPSSWGWIRWNSDRSSYKGARDPSMGAIIAALQGLIEDTWTLPASPLMRTAAFQTQARMLKHNPSLAAAPQLTLVWSAEPPASTMVIHGENLWVKMVPGSMEDWAQQKCVLPEGAQSIVASAAKHTQPPWMKLIKVLPCD